MINYQHTPVLLEEVLEFLQPQANQDFIDCTIGGGGQAKKILEKTAPNGRLLGIDLDPAAIKAVKKQSPKFQNRLIIVNKNFQKLKQIAYDKGFNNVAGILFDLGLSSAQLQDQSRGFSFLAEGLLDMRFNPEEQTLTAEKILNQYSIKDLENIFLQYGQEKLAKPISQRIIEMRQKEPIKTPAQLVQIIVPIYKKYYQGKSKINPATKVFQALRIAVNNELESLKEALPQVIELLAKGGRVAVISYHSLEDKIVKDFFRKESVDCLCPPAQPTCTCGHKKTLKIITKKPVIPSEEEVIENPRSRSAKLRVAEKI